MSLSLSARSLAHSRLFQYAANIRAVQPWLSCIPSPFPQAAPHKSHDPSLPHAWGRSNPGYPACPLVLHKYLTTSACPQMTYSHRLPVLHRCILGAEPQRGPLGLAARAGSRLSTGGSRRLGRGVSGNSPGSPSALLWPSEWGPHCLCRPDLTHGAEAAAIPLWPDCKECAAVSLPGRPTSKVYLAAKKGHSGLRLALQDPAAVSLAPEHAPAGPARGQVVDMRWLRAWDTSRLHRTAGRAERASARHLASCSCGSGRTR